LYWNHKAGADETEKFWLIEVDPVIGNNQLVGLNEIEGVELNLPILAEYKNNLTQNLNGHGNFTGMISTKANGSESYLSYWRDKDKGWADDVR